MPSPVETSLGVTRLVETADGSGVAIMVQLPRVESDTYSGQERIIPEARVGTAAGR